MFLASFYSANPRWPTGHRVNQLKKTAKFFCVVILLLFTGLVFAQQPVPPLKSRVTDLTGTLTTSQLSELETILADFETRKGAQVVVLMVPTTEPEVIEEYGIRVAEVWKAGRKGVDDGAILLIAKNDRRMRIEVGYGLEGILPDAIAKRIIAETLAPSFRQGDYYGGIRAGVDQMLRVIDGEALPAAKTKELPAKNDGLSSFVPIAFMLVFVVGGVLRAVFGRVFGSVATGGVMAIAAWFFIGIFAAVLAAIVGFLLTLTVGGMGRSGIWSTGGFGGGGWGSGGGGGGGWGGGGGGGFGGGGASGDW
ncbi:MAG: YgcG family protein [Pseudomonadota bacterium]